MARAQRANPNQARTVSAKSPCVGAPPGAPTPPPRLRLFIALSLSIHVHVSLGVSFKSVQPKARVVA
jgi:hypothetical protein